MIFPKVSGSNLVNQKFNLPADFEGDYNIVMLAFTEIQQYTVNTWVDFVREIESQNPAVRVYELPTLPNFNWLQQKMLNYWMWAGIPDPLTRATTITLYTDVMTVLRALELPNTKDIYLLLVDKVGRVYWHTEGGFTAQKGESLRNAIYDLPIVHQV